MKDMYIIMVSNSNEIKIPVTGHYNKRHFCTFVTFEMIYSILATLSSFIKTRANWLDNAAVLSNALVFLNFTRGPECYMTSQKWQKISNTIFFIVTDCFKYGPLLYQRQFFKILRNELYAMGYTCLVDFVHPRKLQRYGGALECFMRTKSWSSMYC